MQTVGGVRTPDLAAYPYEIPPNCEDRPDSMISLMESAPQLNGYAYEIHPNPTNLPNSMNQILPPKFLQFDDSPYEILSHTKTQSNSRISGEIFATAVTVPSAVTAFLPIRIHYCN